MRFCAIVWNRLIGLSHAFIQSHELYLKEMRLNKDLEDLGFVLSRLDDLIYL